LTYTIQPRSPVQIIENAQIYPAEAAITEKPEEMENFDLFISVFDSLNNLYETLKRLDQVLKKNIENDPV
jgi:hypothetical protein